MKGKAMLLPQDIIFYQIQIKFSARYLCKMQELEVGAPTVF